MLMTLYISSMGLWTIVLLGLYMALMIASLTKHMKMVMMCFLAISEVYIQEKWLNIKILKAIGSII